MDSLAPPDPPIMERTLILAGSIAQIADWLEDELRRPGQSLGSFSELREFAISAAHRVEAPRGRIIFTVGVFNSVEARGEPTFDIDGFTRRVGTAFTVTLRYLADERTEVRLESVCGGPSRIEKFIDDMTARWPEVQRVTAPVPERFVSPADRNADNVDCKFCTDYRAAVNAAATEADKQAVTLTWAMVGGQASFCVQGDVLRHKRKAHIDKTQHWLPLPRDLARRTDTP